MLKIIKKPETAKTTADSANAAEDKGSGKTTSKALVSEGFATLQGFPPMCIVSLEVGYSHKLPSEDWIKVGIKLDIPAEYKDIDKVFAYVKEWTDAKLNAAVEEITAG
jgi:hypothetical protein